VTGIIPEQNPIGDSFTGSIIQIGEAQALTTFDTAENEAIATGAFVVRYGLRFLGKLHVSIVPGLVVLDYGEILTGEEAWDFLLKNSNLYPRSEVFGYKNDGKDDTALIRTLDMAIAPEVLVYRDGKSTKPIAKPTALIAPNTNGLSDRLLSSLSHYASLADWQAEMKS
jgi:hypothetical protein